METDHALVAAVDAYDEARMAANFTGHPADFAAYRERERMSPANKAAIAPFIAAAIEAHGRDRAEMRSDRPSLDLEPPAIWIRLTPSQSAWGGTAIRKWSTVPFPDATEYRRVPR